MQYTPPHSPDPHGIQTNLGHGRFPIGTALQLQQDQKPEDQFAKRPISPPLSSGENSDSQIKESHPVSLLSALMHSPRSTSNPASSGSGMLSPHSSVPSTAVSSPHLRPVSSAHSHMQGGLEIPAMSILRRDSYSSDGEALSNGMTLSQQAEKPQGELRPDVVKRASSLKFAVAPPLKRRTSVNPHTLDPQAVPKFDTPPTRSDPDISVEIEEDMIEEDINEEEMNEDGSEESDLGYQEDSESSDEDGDSPRYRTGKKYPFARPTNYRLRRPNPDVDRALSPSPPPAPAVLPPPTRRGRGHIRVDESCISGKETDAGCSRHRSPPPSRSRSHSRNRHGMGEGRLSDAGPRQGRAGSPMPSRSKILAASDEEEEDEDDKGESPVDKKDDVVFGNWGGWRSDDAAFKGGMVKGIRTVSAPGQGQSAITDDEDPQIASIHDDSGVRSFFRRASEHIPIPSLRRDPSPSPYPQPQPTQRSPSAAGRALSPSGSPCPPALDETPILARSVARVERDYSGGLAHRLEQSLSASARSEGDGTR